MQLELINSPFGVHNNVLFEYVKKSLIDSFIYDTSSAAYPYVDDANLYTFRLTSNYYTVRVLINDIDYMILDGTGDTHSHTFNVPVQKGDNVIKITDEEKKVLYDTFTLSCYNVHFFLAVFADQFKQLRNKLQQGHANIYYADNLIKDIDNNSFISQQSKYSKEIASLLNTNRYSGFTATDFYAFLHKVFSMTVTAGSYEAFNQLSDAFSFYVENITLTLLNTYRPASRRPQGRVFVNSSVKNQILIRPCYLFLNNKWNILPYTIITPSALLGSMFRIYVDGEVETSTTSADQDKLLIKFSNDLSITNEVASITETFLTDSLSTDDEGFYTGTSGETFVTLSNPVEDEDSITVSNDGEVRLSDSGKTSIRYVSKYNLVSLGTLYRNELGTVNVTYNTRYIPLVLGKAERTTNNSNILRIGLSGHPNTDSRRGSFYSEFKFITTTYSEGVLDSELKQIINKLVRDILPVNCSYYLRFAAAGSLFYAWGQEDITLQEVEDLGVTFGDLF